MKNIGTKVLCGMLLCGVFLGVNNVNAASYNYDTTSEFSARNTTSSGWNGNMYIRMGFKMCSKSDVLATWNSYYMYTWDNSNTGGNLANWPGVVMPEVEGDVRCYTRTIDDGKHYNKIIFDNGKDGNDKRQTIDLDVIDDSGRLVNSLAYLFNESDRVDGGNYKGRWAVNDTSALIDMVAVAKGLDANKYTTATYATVLDALGSDVPVEEVTVDNQYQYNLGADYVSKLTLSNDVLGKLNIGNEGEIYTSEYLNAYNKLGNALNNLVEKKIIMVDGNIANGSVSAGYKTGSDNDINITVSPNLGYETESITVKEIVSFDQSGDPVFGGETDIDVEPGVDNYEFSFGESSLEGYYITVTFKAKTYNIIFIVGENGEIKTMSDEDVESPVQVYYGDDYSLKIIANEGYEIDTILVNGEEYSMVGGVLTIKNIVVDTEVKIAFKLQSYTIVVDGRAYSFDFGTTYEQMLEELDLEKEGYRFLYLVDKDGNRVPDGYVVQGDAEFATVYEKNEDIVVPDTGSNQGSGEGAKYSLIGCASVGAVMGAVLMIAKQRRDDRKNK
ncbi:starch-binding protein [Candidatus Saccharibacteria bacterium]|nr:starch-binding protein [Candidatus Saccharibacteria bacterium]